ncbi:hypothetical protein VCHA54P495_100036 [Vibrio chagasii]|nr:hypothetical protein VCHA54P495_100036 [Vibrio chagasii]
MKKIWFLSGIIKLENDIDNDDKNIATINSVLIPTLLKGIIL